MKPTGRELSEEQKAALRSAAAGDETRKNHHCVDREFKQGKYDCGYGVAVVECHEADDGEFWVNNGEYANPVNYCPFCGAKAPTSVEYEP